MDKIDQELIVITKESELPTEKIDVLIAAFNEPFQRARNVTAQAQALVVTEEGDKVGMRAAHQARMMLKSIRVEVEANRKQLKEQSLREGKAIDGIANIIKAVIVPAEQHLELQETFASRAAAKREREAEEFKQRELEKQERLREAQRVKERKALEAENAKLRKEAELRERELEIERERAAEARRVQQEVEDRERAVQQAEVDRLEAEAAAERKQKRAPDKVKLMELAAALPHAIQLEVDDLVSDEAKAILVNTAAWLQAGAAALKERANRL